MRFHTPAALAFFTSCVVAVEFEKVGNGKCLDCDDNLYDAIFFDVPLSTSADVCEPLCKGCAPQVANRKFLAFEYHQPSFTCLCMFENDSTGFTGDECKDIGAFAHDSGLAGTGEVCSSTAPRGFLEYECWKALAPSPSPPVPHSKGGKTQSLKTKASKTTKKSLSIDSTRSRD